MEVKVIIGLDDATQKIICEMTAAIAGKSVAKVDNPSQEKAIEQKGKYVHISTKNAKEVTELSDVEVADSKDFVAELDEIDAKREKSQYTVEEVRSTLAAKKKAGFGPQIKAVLKSFNVSMVSDLDPANYASVIAQVNALK